MPPVSPEPDLHLAARLLAEDRSAEAVERLGALVADAPVYAAAHALHATALEADGRPAEALAAWGRVAALVPSSPLAHRERRRLLSADAADAAPPAPADAAPAPPSQPAPTDAAPPAPAAPADLRAVDERFLRDDDAADDADPESNGADGEPEADASGVFFGDASPVPSAALAAELLPPEAPAPPDPLHVTPEAPGGAGWMILGEEEHAPAEGGAGADVVSPEAAPTDAAPAERHPVADELDSLISQLESAPRIRPDPTFSGPAVTFDDSDVEEIASETLAKIFAAQRQFEKAADVYETLAARHPARADELLELAGEMRERR
ncbi:hypothetical protein RQM47_02235 [Rubrivirga sp. S365]|uniref:Tetratricopeptide repeat protein n=1 Tax=Rubrivirga litoralis TaxID=3075598 RepID=A0ABU3BTN0_9BACT|nr:MULTISPECIES: hypothetical protein [unclassified Rubrivirga]MDT0632633.1 hypothetical protein [Rubrivirga sp. F394]MDT7855455.1 hypothetical protein [Rubrivirga sp. S365]